MPNVPVTGGSGYNIATNTVTRDAVTEQIQLFNLSDSTGANYASVTANGALSVINSSSTSTRTSASVTTAATSLLASNSSRKLALLFNSHSSNIVYIYLGSTGSTTDYSFQLSPLMFFELPLSYTGAVGGIMASSTANVLITELT